MKKVNYKNNNHQVCFGRVNLMTSLMEQKSNTSKTRTEVGKDVCELMMKMDFGRISVHVKNHYVYGEVV